MMLHGCHGCHYVSSLDLHLGANSFEFKLVPLTNKIVEFGISSVLYPSVNRLRDNVYRIPCRVPCKFLGIRTLIP